ncbi:MAG TPA: tetratricopeptide repeat protein [Vicinamibacterales bacterium]
MSGRSWFGLAGCAAIALIAAQPACARQPSGDPIEAWRTGDYDAAIAGLQRAADAADAPASIHVAYTRVLMEVGRYAEAERAAVRAGDRNADLALALANVLGETQYAQGKVEEAEASFRRAVDGRAPDALTARLNLAVLEQDRGNATEALRLFDSFIDVYNGAENLSASDLSAVATAVRHLGVTDSQLYRDALRAYDEAIAAAGAAPGRSPFEAFEPRVRLADMFLAKYRSSDAQETLAEVLSVNPRQPDALLVRARAKYFDGTPEAVELVRQALEVNPNLVPARVFNARLRIDFEDWDGALDEAEKALEVNPVALDAMAVIAAVHYLRGETAEWQRARDRVLAINPRYAHMYTLVAELAVRQRQYAGAVELAQRAVEIDTLSWEGYGLLGINQLRTGDIEAGRRNLEIAFEGDPHNVWNWNTLELLDTFSQYREVASERFSFMLFEGEAGLLGPYMTELAEEAYDSLAKRYGVQVATPVRVEVFPSHEDFSVRTVGLAGLGALGVSFGNVLAMDSPSARERGEFNWGSTLWHEIAHAFTLHATDHKVPRWLTEGLSVLEERRARPGWGDDVRPEWLLAWKADRLLPVSRLNEGFVRPRYPAQISFSYYQASLVAELIEREHGMDAIRRMLAGYRDGLDDAQVFRTVLNTDLEDFDEAFAAWVEGRFAKPLAAIRVPSGMRDTADIAPFTETEPSGPPAPDDLFGQFAEGRRLFAEGRYAQAKPFLERARTLFPENTSGGGPYGMLARVRLEEGDTAGAIAELRALTALDENAYEANLQVAELLEATGDAAGAAQALERIVYVYPYEMELHTRIAALRAQLEDWPAVVRARRAIVALRPVDRAEALYQLALAYFNAGDRAAARREVLAALEVAPGFAEAQELLLRIAGGAP